MTVPPTLPVEPAAEAHAQQIVLGARAALPQNGIVPARQ